MFCSTHAYIALFWRRQQILFPRFFNICLTLKQETNEELARLEGNGEGEEDETFSRYRTEQVPYRIQGRYLSALFLCAYFVRQAMRWRDMDADEGSSRVLEVMIENSRESDERVCVCVRSQKVIRSDCGRSRLAIASK